MGVKYQPETVINKPTKRTAKEKWCLKVRVISDSEDTADRMKVVLSLVTTQMSPQSCGTGENEMGVV